MIGQGQLADVLLSEHQDRELDLDDSIAVRIIARAIGDPQDLGQQRGIVRSRAALIRVVSPSRSLVISYTSTAMHDSGKMHDIPNKGAG